jgi:hypothetical protein
LKAYNPSALSKLSKIEGIAVKGSYNEIIKIFFPIIAVHNPQMKILITLSEPHNPGTIYNLLKIGFEKYSFIDCAVMSSIKFLESNGTSSQFTSICTYNPFIDFLFCRNFTDENFMEAGKELKIYMDQKLDNLYGYRLKVHFCGNVGKAKYGPTDELPNFNNWDKEIVKIYEKYLNFQASYLECDGTYTGFQYPNGTFTGGLAATEYGLADLVANGRPALHVNTTKSAFLHPVSKIGYYFMISKPTTTKDVFRSFIRSMDLPSTIFFLAMLIILPITFHIIFKVEQKFFKLMSRKMQSFNETILKFVGIICSESVNIQHSPLSLRLFITVMLFYSFIFTSLFQGTILKNLNTDFVMGDIRTLDQLLDNNYELRITSAQSLIVKSLSGSRMLERLRKEAQHTRPVLSLRASYIPAKHEASLMKENLIKLKLLLSYDPETKEDLYTIVPQCAFKVLHAMMVPKNSPYQDKFNNLLQRIIEAGIIEYQVSLIEIEFMKVKIQRVKDGNMPPLAQKKIKMDQIRSIIYLYLTFVFLAIIVFVVELFYHRFKVFVRNYR